MENSTGTRVGVTLALIGVTTLVGIAVDLLLLPGHSIALAYMIPLLIAAYYLSPKHAIAFSALALVFSIVSGFLKQIPASVWPYYTVYLAVAATILVRFSSRLSRQRQTIAERERKNEDLVNTVRLVNEQLIISSVAMEKTTEREQDAREQVQTQNRELQAQKETLQNQTADLSAAHQRTEALASIVMQLNAGRSVSEVVQTVSTRTASLIGGRDGRLFLFKEDHRHLSDTFEPPSGIPDGIDPDIDAMPNYKRAVETRKTVYLTSLETESAETAWFLQLDIWGSLVCPLVADSYCLGFLCVFFQEENYVPAAEDIAFVEAIAGQCALAIDRGRLDEERNQLINQLRDANQSMAIFGMRAKEQAEEAERRAAELAATVDSIPHGVIIYDTKGEVVRTNTAALRILGYEESGMDRPAARVGTFRSETLDGKTLVLEETPVYRALQGERVPETVVVLHPSPERAVLVSISAAPIKDANGERLGAVSILAEVSDLGGS